MTVLVRAIDAHDVSTVVRYVNFDRVRASLTEQIASAYVRMSGIQPGPLGQQAVVVGLASGRRSGHQKAGFAGSAVGTPCRGLASRGRARPAAVRHSRDKHCYAGNCLADLCRVSLWHWEVRSVGAYDTAGSEPVSPNVPSVIGALATGWHHPSRERSQFARE